MQEHDNSKAVGFYCTANKPFMFHDRKCKLLGSSFNFCFSARAKMEMY